MPIIDLKSELRTLAERIYDSTKTEAVHRRDDANRMLKFFGSAQGAIFAAKQAALSPEDALERIARTLKATQLARVPFGLADQQITPPSKYTTTPKIPDSDIKERFKVYDNLINVKTEAKDWTPYTNPGYWEDNKYDDPIQIGKDKLGKRPAAYESATMDGKDQAALLGMDIVPFYFTTYNLSNGKVELGTSIPFPAFVSNITDSTGGTWNSMTFAGRGELFHVYQTYSRTMSISFQVAAFSEDELSVIHEKLEYLRSLAAPKYTTNGFMQGNVINLTIGNYAKGLPGFLTNVGFTVDSNVPWETRKGKQKLPHVVNVQVGYTVIEPTTPKVLV